jgi:hypothetical protein
MAAFLGISVWISLATIVPGLITIATIGGALVVISPTALDTLIRDLKGLNEWSYAGLAITIMVMTQAFGILLEKVLISKHWLGPREKDIDIPPGIDPLRETSFPLRPYYEYQGLYLLLAELQENEDTQGHLQRALAQFFLTINSLVSFAAGIVASLVLLYYSTMAKAVVAVSYIALLTLFLTVSFLVAQIRFEVMAKALWAARRRRTGAVGGK